MSSLIPSLIILIRNQKKVKTILRAGRWINSQSQSLDQEYMAAVDAGDEETQAWLVEQAARAAGYDSPKLYHGTGAFGFIKVEFGFLRKIAVHKANCIT